MFFISTRTCVSLWTSNNVSYASSQSSQTSQQLTGSQETEDSAVQQEERFEKLNDFLCVE